MGRRLLGRWASRSSLNPSRLLPVLAVVVSTAIRVARTRATLRLIAMLLVMFVIVVSPWILHGDARRSTTCTTAYSRANNTPGACPSAAWNIWWFPEVRSHPLPGDPLLHAASWPTYKRAGLALSLAAMLLALAYTWRKPALRGTLVAAAYMVFAFYVLPTSSHERYRFPLLGLLLPVVVAKPRWLWLYLPISATFTVNLLASHRRCTTGQGDGSTDR